MKGNIALITLAVFIISVIITLNFFLQENYKAEMAEQFNKQQLLLAETVSKNIEGHFLGLEEGLMALARLLRNKPLRSPSTISFIEEASKGIIGVGPDVSLRVFDENKSVLYGASDGPATTEDLSLVEESKGAIEGKPVYLDKTSEEKTVKMAAPIEGGGGRLGALMLDISLEAVNRDFLSHIKSGQRGYAWMMDSNGTLLYHPVQPGMIGKNLYRTEPSCFGCHKSFDVERWILDADTLGAKTYISPLGEDKLIAFSRAKVLGTEWIVCVSIPYSEITASIGKSMRLHSILIIAIFGAAALGAFTTLILNIKRIKAEEKARREEDLKRYANELEETVGERTKELSDEKEKLNTILDTVAGGLMLMDTEGRIQWANRKVAEMAGTEVVGRKYSDICPDSPEEKSLTSEDASTTLIEDLFGRKGRFFQVTSAPVKSQNAAIGHINFIQDVTEMKKVEEQMAHSEKLSSLGRLTAGIAHEIGNPLTSVFSFLQILRERETEGFKKESLDTIIFHINRIADIVRQLSGLSKLPPSALKEVQVNDLIESSLSLLKYDKRAKNISVTNELASDLPPIVTDGSQLSQVFVNLILNAVDAMPEGGTLRVRSSLGTTHIAVEFKDTGHGIQKENLTRLFDPFFTTKDKGTGLGLSVSYGIIKRLGGDISVESEPEKGSRFTVTLPLKGQDDAA